MSMSDRERLLDAVLEQIIEDVVNSDMTAIHEMIMELHDSVLKAYLSEDYFDEQDE